MNTAINISELISTKERENILTRLLYSSHQLSLHQIARDAGVSPSQVHKYISICKKYGLIKDTIMKDYPVVRALRLMENIVFLEKSKLADFINSQIKNAKGIGIYGSWARGTNNENADIDIWVFGEKEADDLTMGKIRRTLEKKLERKVDIIYLNSEKLQQLKEKNPNMYYSLYHSIKLWGNEIW